MFVTLYTPPADADPNSTKVLGVFKSKKKAFQKATQQLLIDIDKKYGDTDSEKKKKKAKEIIDKIRGETDYNDAFQQASGAVTKAYGESDDAPYCEVSTTPYDVKPY